MVILWLFKFSQQSSPKFWKFLKVYNFTIEFLDKFIEIFSGFGGLAPRTSNESNLCNNSFFLEPSQKRTSSGKIYWTFHILWNFLDIFYIFYNFNENPWKITPNFMALPNIITFPRPSKTGPSQTFDGPPQPKKSLIH